MRKFIFIFILLLGAAFSFSLFAQPLYFVADKHQTENIQIKPEKLSAFLNKWYNLETKLDAMKIESRNKRFFLMAKDKVADKVYVMRLLRKDDALYIFKYNIIGACGCDQMSLDEFNFEKNKIHGCKGMYSTAGAY